MPRTEPLDLARLKKWYETHSGHSYDADTGLSECECCCRSALDYDAQRTEFQQQLVAKEAECERLREIRLGLHQQNEELGEELSAAQTERDNALAECERLRGDNEDGKKRIEMLKDASNTIAGLGIREMERNIRELIQAIKNEEAKR